MFNTQKLANSEKCSVDYLTDTKQICNKPCLLLDVGASYVTEFKYASPVIVDDGAEVWANEENTIDGDFLTRGRLAGSGIEWVPGLIFWPRYTTGIIGFRFLAKQTAVTTPTIRIEYDNNIEWTVVYEGAFTNNLLTEKFLSGMDICEKVRVRFYRDVTDAVVITFYEFELIYRKVLDVSLYDGFDNTDDKKHRMALATTGNIFNHFTPSIYFDKGLYAEFVESIGNVCVQYLVLKRKTWSIPQVSQRRKLHIPGLHRFVQLYRLIRDWFTR